ncbi:MAG: hypothetical protein L0Y72_19785 [Gemmataceae bacterium]|nr:hypothetical protein [Gemmataceae bacterium]MCI0741279.1 hypothetical protein [Gemmataceae bacterium]
MRYNLQLQRNGQVGNLSYQTMAWNDRDSATTALRAYLLGTVDFEATLQLQRRLHYEISGDRSQAALLLCEHPPLISVGRTGSRGQIFWEPDELKQLGWRIRWVNRGGGCWLHLPGQLAVYCIFPVAPVSPRPIGQEGRGRPPGNEPLPSFLQQLSEAMRRTLADFRITSAIRPGGLWVGERLIAGLGVAMRDWVSYYGMCLNVHPDLAPYGNIRCAPRCNGPMTSLARERRGLVRPAHVRELLVENLQNVFGFSRVSLFTDHPALDGCQERLADRRVASSRSL